MFFMFKAVFGMVSIQKESEKYIHLWPIIYLNITALNPTSGGLAQNRPCRWVAHLRGDDLCYSETKANIAIP